MATNAIILIPIDPALLNPRHLSLLEKELKDLPSPTQQEKVPEELTNILSFIKNRKVLKRLASFKDISKEFNITAPTTKKKLRELQEYGLIRIVKQGRNKLLEPTPQGERLS
jgi:DNA-binding MarR family transcriptional regulator